MKAKIPFTVKCEYRGGHQGVRYQFEYWSWKAVPIRIRNSCRDVMFHRLDEATAKVIPL